MGTDLDALRQLTKSGLIQRLDQVLEETKRPGLFGIFPRALRRESLHSDVICWLLHSNESHGLQGRFADEFLRRLLEDSHVGHDSQGRSVRDRLGAHAKIKVVEAWAEESTGDGVIDILISGLCDGQDVLIGIENKIGAPEGLRRNGSQPVGQLRAYARALSERNADATVVVALLSPTGIEPKQTPTTRWATLSYRHVLDSLEAALRGGLDPGSPFGLGRERQVAVDYSLAIRRYVMGTDPEVMKLMKELYRDHKRAWEVIRRDLPSERDELLDLLGESACERFRAQCGGEWKAEVRRNAYAVLARSQWERAFGVWTGTNLVAIDEDGDQPTIAGVHFRLGVTLGGQGRGAKRQPKVTVKLKCQLTRFAGSAEALEKELSPVLGRSTQREGSRQFSFSLTNGRTLPHVVQDPTPDKQLAETVMSFIWRAYGQQLRTAAKIIDAAAQTVLAHKA